MSTSWRKAAAAVRRLEALRVIALVPLAALVACVVDTPAPEPVPAERSQSAAAVGLGSSAADQRMRAFGERNPSCPLWTNWQKLCSRTGPDGGVHCNADPGRPVEPSAPFCTAFLPTSNSMERPGAQGASHNRFCAASKTFRITDDVSKKTKKVRACTRYDPERPFNGRRLASLIHPGCDAWIDRNNRELVCTVDGSRGVPTCASLAAAGYEHSDLLQCNHWSGPKTCKATPIFEPEPMVEGEIEIPVDGNIVSARGISCAIYGAE